MCIFTYKMRPRVHLGITWSVEELKKLIDNANSCVYLEKSRKHVALHPIHLNDLNKAFYDILGSTINFYDSQFKGLLLAYKSPKLVSHLGTILYDSHFIHVDIEADFYIFRPEVGRILTGTINKKADNYIGVLVHKVFNVSIPKSEDDSHWDGDKFDVGDDVTFTVVHVDLKGKLPFIRGKLLSSNSSSSKISTQVRSKTFNSDDESDNNDDNDVDDISESSRKNKNLLNNSTFLSTTNSDSSDSSTSNESSNGMLVRKKSTKNKKYADIPKSSTKNVEKNSNIQIESESTVSSTEEDEDDNSFRVNEAAKSRKSPLIDEISANHIEKLSSKSSKKSSKLNDREFTEQNCSLNDTVYGKSFESEAVASSTPLTANKTVTCASERRKPTKGNSKDNIDDNTSNTSGSSPDKLRNTFLRRHENNADRHQEISKKSSKHQKRFHHAESNASGNASHDSDVEFSTKTKNHVNKKSGQENNSSLLDSGTNDTAANKKIRKSSKPSKKIFELTEDIINEQRTEKFLNSSQDVEIHASKKNKSSKLSNKSSHRRIKTESSDTSYSDVNSQEFVNMPTVDIDANEVYQQSMKKYKNRVLKEERNDGKNILFNEEEVDSSDSEYFSRIASGTPKRPSIDGRLNSPQKLPRSQIIKTEQSDVDNDPFHTDNDNTTYDSESEVLLKSIELDNEKINKLPQKLSKHKLKIKTEKKDTQSDHDCEDNSRSDSVTFKIPDAQKHVHQEQKYQENYGKKRKSSKSKVTSDDEHENPVSQGRPSQEENESSSQSEPAFKSPKKKKKREKESNEMMFINVKQEPVSDTESNFGKKSKSKKRDRERDDDTEVSSDSVNTEKNMPYEENSNDKNTHGSNRTSDKHKKHKVQQPSTSIGKIRIKSEFEIKQEDSIMRKHSNYPAIKIKRESTPSDVEETIKKKKIKTVFSE